MCLCSIIAHNSRDVYKRQDCMDETVFKGEPKGDGMFDDDERAYWMDLCLSAISKYVDDHPELLDKLKNYDILRNL